MEFDSSRAIECLQELDSNGDGVIARVVLAQVFLAEAVGNKQQQ